jgi:hypothetical protein
MSIAIVAASVSADLVVGLLLGAAIGFLAGPLVRGGLAVREWREASREAREARLTDELLFRIEELSDLPDGWPETAPDTDTEPATDADAGPAPSGEPGQAAEPVPDDRTVPWRTSR